MEPEIVPSKFEEDLPHSSFEDPHEYPVATATQKAIEVYQRLVVSRISRLSANLSTVSHQDQSPDDPPDLVIGGTYSRVPSPAVTECADAPDRSRHSRSHPSIATPVRLTANTEPRPRCTRTCTRERRMGKHVRRAASHKATACACTYISMRLRVSRVALWLRGWKTRVRNE